LSAPKYPVPFMEKDKFDGAKPPEAAKPSGSNQ